MFAVKITVIHALGKFEGYMNLKEEHATEENARTLVEELEQSVNEFKRLVLTTHTGASLALNEKILGEAIMIFEAEEVV